MDNPPQRLLIRHGGPLRGEVSALDGVSLPGDKSLSHRAALFAALAEGESRIENFQISGVTQAMLAALTQLGVSWILNGNTLNVSGMGLDGLTFSAEPINCGNSATTLRLLAGAIAAAGVSAVLDGSPGLRRRPMGRIIDPLRQMGVVIRGEKDCAPLVIERSTLPLKSLDYTLPVASAQVKTCLLLAALASDGVTTLREPGPSRDHSERMLRKMGVEITSNSLKTKEGQESEIAWHVTKIQPPDPPYLRPLEVVLPGDFSAAAFLIVAALIVPASSVTLQDIGLNPTRIGLLDALKAMGGNIQVTIIGGDDDEPVGEISVKASSLHGIEIAGELVVRMIDEFPVFAVAAAYANGRTEVMNAAELRTKESDRISSLCQELRQLGVQIEETVDGFIIHGGHPVRHGRVRAHGDHRLAMAMAVAGLAGQGEVVIEGAELIGESYPGFMATLQRLGADINADAL